MYKKPWMDEFLNGKLIALTKEKEGELRERYKEKYGEYPPGNVNKSAVEIYPKFLKLL